MLYALSCVLCNSGDAGALAAGRLLGGVAYSILYTSFESWLIAEADAVGAPPLPRDSAAAANACIAIRHTTPQLSR